MTTKIKLGEYGSLPLEVRYEIAKLSKGCDAMSLCLAGDKKLYEEINNNERFWEEKCTEEYPDKLNLQHSSWKDHYITCLFSHTLKAKYNHGYENSKNIVGNEIGAFSERYWVPLLLTIPKALVASVSSIAFNRWINPLANNLNYNVAMHVIAFTTSYLLNRHSDGDSNFSVANYFFSEITLCSFCSTVLKTSFVYPIFTLLRSRFELRNAETNQEIDSHVHHFGEGIGQKIGSLTVVRFICGISNATQEMYMRWKNR